MVKDNLGVLKIGKNHVISLFSLWSLTVILTFKLTWRVTKLYKSFAFERLLSVLAENNEFRSFSAVLKKSRN